MGPRGKHHLRDLHEGGKNNFQRTICRTNKNAVTCAIELFGNKPTSFVNEDRVALQRARVQQVSGEGHQSQWVWE